jgi:RNA polymerase sigma-B factor
MSQNPIERSWGQLRRSAQSQSAAKQAATTARREAVSRLFFTLSPAFQLSFLINLNPVYLPLYHLQWCKRLATLHHGIARTIAHKYTEQCPERYEDLENIAAIGVMRAATKFDPRIGATFSALAMQYAEGEIKHFIRDHWGPNAKVPRRFFENVGTVRKAKSGLSPEDIAARESFGVASDDQAVAIGLGFTSEKWQSTVQATKRLNVRSYEALASRIPEPESDEARDYQPVRQALAQMPNLDRQIVTKVWMRGLSIARAAKEHQVSEAEIGVILDRAKKRLQQQLKQYI